MHDNGLLEEYAFSGSRSAPPAQPLLILLAALLTALISAAVCVAAILGPAPAAAIPLVVVISIGCPMFAGWEVPNALAALRANRAAKALGRLRRSLDQLPETEHPLGL
jgi:fatty acid desaturase